MTTFLTFVLAIVNLSRRMPGMQPAVSPMLAGVLSRVTSWDDFGDVCFSRLQSEPEARFSGWRHSPQQAESLAAAVRPFLINF